MRKEKISAVCSLEFGIPRNKVLVRVFKDEFVAVGVCPSLLRELEHDLANGPDVEAHVGCFADVSWVGRGVKELCSVHVSREGDAQRLHDLPVVCILVFQSPGISPLALLVFALMLCPGTCYHRMQRQSRSDWES